MPRIVSTRDIKLNKFQNDNVQWLLTRHHSKHCFSKTDQPLYSNHKDSNDTLDIAQKLLDMLQSNNRDLLSVLAQEVRQLYKKLKFSSKTCVDYLVRNTKESKTASLLELYYLLSTQLRDTLALRLKLILQDLSQTILDRALYELLDKREEAAKAYIAHLSSEQLNYFFLLDINHFLEWSLTIETEKTKRLFYVLNQYQTNREACLNRILFINQLTDQEPIPIVYYKAIEKTKRRFLSNRYQENDKDLVLEYLSCWFFEFDHNSNLNITEFTTRSLQSAFAIDSHTIPDITVLFYIYSSGCKKLVAEDKDTLRIFDIMDSITKAILVLLDESTDFGGLGILLAFAQLTLHHIQTDLSYPTWFENTFISPKTSQLTKKMYTVFLKMLEEMLPYELPSILQIHARLLELGVDNSLKRYPTGFKTPLQRMSSTTAPTAIQDEVASAIDQFIKKEGSIPTGLLQNFVFRRQWFIATFLPALFSWKSADSKKNDAKLNLIRALKEKGKISESMYKEFMNEKT
ncbi:hypothetical protein G6F56_007751 [Rhizopus delemar]|nr:hypothetical protein G6F56_007751 [Rhizopus delemar]